MTREQLKTEMEIFADKLGIYELRTIIAEICFEKAEHVRCNFPDDSKLAATWDKLGEYHINFYNQLNDSQKSLDSSGTLIA